ncbi:unnamed protein product [Cyprideis torosa]|uniref:Uncharacterized protein n=1 Tax=Cyprideis torosa TaxID=163714 RepID=A0A7R8W3Y9_9CRUS|nr:unnamed protein product [Cyprideis torosa]CAG0883542.1 unnamed protein product [Cyprideis torosa]
MIHKQDLEGGLTRDRQTQQPSQHNLVRALNDRTHNRLEMLRSSKIDPAQSGAVSTGPRVIHQSSNMKKTIDSEDVEEHSELVDGELRTEKTKTVYHKDIVDREVPDEGSDQEPTPVTNTHSEQQRITYPTPQYGQRESAPSSQSRESPRRFHPTNKTSRPVPEMESDEARKFETSKWLESHFGSSGSEASEDRGPKRGSSVVNIRMDERGHSPLRTPVAEPAARAPPPPPPPKPRTPTHAPTSTGGVSFGTPMPSRGEPHGASSYSSLNRSTKYESSLNRSYENEAPSKPYGEPYMTSTPYASSAYAPPKQETLPRSTKYLREHEETPTRGSPPRENTSIDDRRYESSYKRDQTSSAHYKTELTAQTSGESTDLAPRRRVRYGSDSTDDRNSSRYRTELETSRERRYRTELELQTTPSPPKFKEMNFKVEKAPDKDDWVLRKISRSSSVNGGDPGPGGRVFGRPVQQSVLKKEYDQIYRQVLAEEAAERRRGSSDSGGSAPDGKGGRMSPLDSRGRRDWQDPELSSSVRRQVYRSTKDSSFYQSTPALNYENSRSPTRRDARTSNTLTRSYNRPSTTPPQHRPAGRVHSDPRSPPRTPGGRHTTVTDIGTSTLPRSSPLEQAVSPAASTLQRRTPPKVADISHSTAPPPTRPERKKKRVRHHGDDPETGGQPPTQYESSQAPLSADVAVYTHAPRVVDRLPRTQSERRPERSNMKWFSSAKREQSYKSSGGKKTSGAGGVGPSTTYIRSGADSPTRHDSGSSSATKSTYYLGEDPFRSSLFNNEKYDNVRDVKREVRMMKRQSEKGSGGVYSPTSSLQRSQKEPHYETSQSKRHQDHYETSQSNKRHQDHLETSTRRQQDHHQSSFQTNSLNRSQESGSRHRKVTPTRSDPTTRQQQQHLQSTPNKKSTEVVKSTPTGYVKEQHEREDRPGGHYSRDYVETMNKSKSPTGRGELEETRMVKRSTQEYSSASRSDGTPPSNLGYGSMTLDRSWKHQQRQEQPMSSTMPRKPKRMSEFQGSREGSSSINISIKNEVKDSSSDIKHPPPPPPPIKPMRGVNRSQSFNTMANRTVLSSGHPDNNSSRINITGYTPLSRGTSLTRLDDTSSPLKCPDIIKRVQRSASMRRNGSLYLDREEWDPAMDSTKPESPHMEERRDSSFRSPLTTSSPAPRYNKSESFTARQSLLSKKLSTGLLSNGTTTNVDGEEKKTKFLQGLMTTAPELYQHLEGHSSTRTERSSLSPPPRLIRPEAAADPGPSRPIRKFNTSSSLATDEVLQRTSSSSPSFHRGRSPVKETVSFSQQESPTDGALTKTVTTVTKRQIPSENGGPPRTETIERTSTNRRTHVQTREQEIMLPKNFSQHFKYLQQPPSHSLIEIRDWNSR